MPDLQTGRRRRFLVLHDTLPRGTGYLQRLADQAEFRDVLDHARRIVAAGGAGLTASLMLADQEISEAELSMLGAVRSATVTSWWTKPRI